MGTGYESNRCLPHCGAIVLSRLDDRLSRLDDDRLEPRLLVELIDDGIGAAVGRCCPSACGAGLAPAGSLSLPSLIVSLPLTSLGVSLSLTSLDFA